MLKQELRRLHCMLRATGDGKTATCVQYLNVYAFKMLIHKNRFLVDFTIFFCVPHVTREVCRDGARAMPCGCPLPHAEQPVWGIDDETEFPSHGRLSCRAEVQR